jgi:hypothetical protein
VQRVGVKSLSLNENNCNKVGALGSKRTKNSGAGEVIMSSNKKKPSTSIFFRTLALFIIASGITYMIVLILGWIGIDVPLIFYFVNYLLILAIVLYYYHRTSYKDIRKERAEIKDQSNAELKNLPKVYEFYCSRCLFQTNEEAKLCPNCKEGRLLPTT